ncbi:phosphopantetheine-binding protein [Actinokineospora bangkokensis]|uniref:Carrier domain-containing protein n=1 Tax=Actinokineospora bangkokensis TaxID=1193682 RepID=A0A1Q9LNW5_9PSEU|nr:phosphopantetheine-binding protein [Actinokineospora bangkokensis]OLR93705.1 hypothetical protein BJP25_15725 [Actinokineospora bangkokensis]
MTAPEQQAVQGWVLDELVALGLPARGAEDDFFAIGGTSMGVVRLVSRAEKEYGEDCLPADELYENSTVRGIAELIVRHAGGAAAAG